MIKAVIFDWGRTIYDKENGKLFSETIEVLEYFSKKYPLAIVSLADDGDIEGRFKLIDKYNLRKYFKFALFHVSDKDSLFRNAFSNFNLDKKEILVVDDYMKRLGFAIKSGCQTVWIKKGKFKDYVPNKETGNPTHTINNLSEILNLNL